MELRVSGTKRVQIEQQRFFEKKEWYRLACFKTQNFRIVDPTVAANSVTKIRTVCKFMICCA